MRDLKFNKYNSIMYKDLMEISNGLNLESNSSKVEFNILCLEYVFTWNPFKRVKNCEPYKKACDKIVLLKAIELNIRETKSFIENGKIKKIKSKTIKDEINKSSQNGFTNEIETNILPLISFDDIKIAYGLKIMEEELRYNRLQNISKFCLSAASIILVFIGTILAALFKAK